MNYLLLNFILKRSNSEPPTPLVCIIYFWLCFHSKIKEETLPLNNGSHFVNLFFLHTLQIFHTFPKCSKITENLFNHEAVVKVLNKLVWNWNEMFGHVWRTSMYFSFLGLELKLFLSSLLRSQGVNFIDIFRAAFS